MGDELLGMVSRVARVRLDNDFRTVAHRTEHGLDVPRLALSAPRLTHSAQRDQHPTLDATPTWKSKTTWSSLRNGAAEIRACRGTRRRPVRWRITSDYFTVTNYLQLLRTRQRDERRAW